MVVGLKKDCGLWHSKRPAVGWRIFAGAPSSHLFCGLARLAYIQRYSFRFAMPAGYDVHRLGTAHERTWGRGRMHDVKKCIEKPTCTETCLVCMKGRVREGSTLWSFDLFRVRASMAEAYGKWECPEQVHVSRRSGY